MNKTGFQYLPKIDKQNPVSGQDLQPQSYDKMLKDSNLASLQLGKPASLPGNINLKFKSQS